MPEPPEERGACPTCGLRGPDAFELDQDTGALEAACGDEWHDAPPQPAPSEHVGKSLAEVIAEKYPSGLPPDPDLDLGPAQPAPAGFETAISRVVELHDIVARIAKSLGGNHEAYLAARQDFDEEIEQLRAEHAKEVAATMEAVRLTPASVVKQMVAESRAAGVAEGRREMAREARIQHGKWRQDAVHRAGACDICSWLEARAGKESRG